MNHTHILNEFNGVIAYLIELRDETLKQFREECTHPKVTEVEYVSREYGDSLPPMRICELCGVEEEGWYCGYKVLVEDDKRIIREISSRDDFFRLRQEGPLCKVGNSLLHEAALEACEE